MKTHLRNWAIRLLWLTCTGTLGLGQSVTNASNVGVPENAVLSGSHIDNVQLNNGNLHVDIPVWSVKGRGLDSWYHFIYDSKGWYYLTTCDSFGDCTDVVEPEPGNTMILSGHTPLSGGFTVKHQLVNCHGVNYSEWTNIVLRESDGTKHHFAPDPVVIGGPQSCVPWQNLSTFYADDGSGWIYTQTSNGWRTLNKHGNGGGDEEDSNGNELLFGTPATDTLGRPIATDGSYYDSGGTQRSLVTATTSVAVQTNLCSYDGNGSCIEYSGTWTVPSQITLPNGLSYSFTYYQNSDGQLKSITLPDGGQITYTYSGGDQSGPLVGSRTVNSGTISGTWTYNGGVVTDPAGNDTQYTCAYFSPNADPACYIQSVQSYLGPYTNHNLLKTVTTDYQTYQVDNHDDWALIPLPIRETTTYNPQNQVSKVETDWDTAAVTTGTFTWQNPIERREYDWGTGASGALLRRTHYNYLHLQNSAYLGANIADRPTDISIYSGSGSPLAETTTTYDGSGLLNTNSGTCQNPAGAPNHDYCNFSSTNLVRGNPTQISRWLNTTNTWLTTTNTYDDLGNLLTSTDPGQHTTTFAYTDSWANAGCVPSGVQTHGYVTQVTNPLGQNTQTQYYPCTGLAYYHRDQNDINAGRVGTTQTYDLMNRPLITTYSDGGQTTIGYNGDPVPPHVTKTILASPNPSVVTDYLFDGLGRIKSTQLTSDPEGADITDTTFDAVGNVLTVSNPYRAGAPSPTDGTTCNGTMSNGVCNTGWDPLGRLTVVTKQDGNFVTTDYSAFPKVTVTDETGRKRASQFDALGRLIYVWEDPAGANYETDYQYNARGDLTSVNQLGDGSAPRTRSFIFDSLSRLVSAHNPETGTITYGYASDATCNPGAEELRTKTDARGTVTTYCYDALHRLAQRSFSDGTAADSYFYDSLSDWTPSNPIGRLLKQYKAFPGGGGGHYFSYDAMGRLTTQWDCLPSNCTNGATTQAGYDLASHLTSLTYPSGRNVTNHYDAGGMPDNVAFASFNGTPVNYTYWYRAANPSAPRTFPNGVPQYQFFGNGNWDLTGLNTRLQTTQVALTSSTTTWSNNLYSYADPAYANKNNGNIRSIVEQLDGSKAQWFNYDSLNRITNAGTTASSGPNAWSEIFSYDPWGNVKQSGGYSFMPVGFDSGNHIVQTGYSYDAAGNLLNDTFHTYAYDGESRITSVDSGVTYTYDADGNRVRKDVGSDSTEYIYFEGQPISEYKPSTGDWSDYIYANGKRIAKADNFDNRIKTVTSVTAKTSWQSASYAFSTLPAGLSTYAIQSGDKLLATQYQAYGHGGLDIWFSDGTRPQSNLHDSDGEMQDYDTRQGVWHQRSFDLTPYAGKTVSYLRLVTQGDTTGASNPWYEWYQGVAIVTASGQVFPFFYKQTSVSLSMGASSGNITPSYVAEHYPGLGTSTAETTTYYHEDHLGTSRLMTSYGGWPIWQGTFLPYGQEWNPQLTTNHYKFTGKERDAESGLDFFGARFYSSAMGRWMSPDWADKPEPVPYADLSDPQSLNLYGYVRNNPMSRFDPDGHCSKGFNWACGVFQRFDNAFHGLGFHTNAQVENILHRDNLFLRHQGIDPEKLNNRQVTRAYKFALAAGARPTAAQARAIWEKATGKKVPWDEELGRFYDMKHKEAIADGGDPFDPKNLEPQQHGEHIQEHIDSGDFARWARRAKQISDEPQRPIFDDPFMEGEYVNDAIVAGGMCGLSGTDPCEQ